MSDRTTASNRQPCAMVMAGGTGGHVFPALSVAQGLQEKGYRIQWLGAPGGIENRLVPQAGIPLNLLTVKGVRGSGVKRKLLAPFMLMKAVIEALSCFRRYQPELAIGFGGFASAPGGVAARLSGVPLVLHEQNAAPGLTNRILSRVATKVTEAFQGAFATGKAIHVGNPVREEIINLADPQQRYSQRSGPINLLVLGGSQGALALNRDLPEALAVMGDVLSVRHQCGKDRRKEAEIAYCNTGMNVEVNEFIDDMAAAYQWADLVVCRAGALTVAEVCCAGVTAVFVPLPHAVDDHQRLNANYLVEQGAAFLLEQKDINQDSIKMIFEKIPNREAMLGVANKARKIAVPDSTKRVVQVCLEVANG